jgi:hypothetical protein
VVVAAGVVVVEIAVVAGVASGGGSRSCGG